MKKKKSTQTPSNTLERSTDEWIPFHRLVWRIGLDLNITNYNKSEWFTKGVVDWADFWVRRAWRTDSTFSKIHTTSLRITRKSSVADCHSGIALQIASSMRPPISLHLSRIPFSCWISELFYLIWKERGYWWGLLEVPIIGGGIRTLPLEVFDLFCLVRKLFFQGLYFSTKIDQFPWWIARHLLHVSVAIVLQFLQAQMHYSLVL